MSGRRARAALAMLFLLLAGCAPAAQGDRTCTVLLEDDPALFFYRQVYEVPRSGDVTIPVGVPTGSRVLSVNYDRYTVSAQTGSSASWDYYDLILHEVRYPMVIRLETAPRRELLYYLPEGGTENVLEDGAHLRPNTLPYDGRFTREGYLPIGWNTAPDGSGPHTGFGSRIDHPGGTVELYVEWLPCTPPEDLTYTERDDGAVITGYTGNDPGLVIPDQLDGLPVTAIASGAFGDVAVDVLALPPTLETVEDEAFCSLAAESVYLFDTLTGVTERSFGAYQIGQLHINAARPPVYSGSYFDAFPDKADYLRSLKDADKLVLFCGSSARFGYDSPMLEAAFPQYKVVNMGVYAYANMLPQARVALRYMKAGDILLSSPELDAIQEQFCGERELDRETFCMVESDYDLFSLLDCREFTGLFDAFGDYQAARRKMSPRSYSEPPSWYDEDGNRVEKASYNVYGDYVLYRENNLEQKNFGVKRAYYNAAHIRPQDWDGLNAVYDAFSAKGVQVYFTYSPRSRTSISEDSTPEAIAELDGLFRRRLHVPVISDIQDSLMDPLYFYATDNHLSTEGVALRTRQVIQDLRTELEAAP